MQLLKVNFSSANKVLSKLVVAKKAPGSWVKMPNKAFSDGKEVSYKLYKLLTGNEIDPNNTFGLVSFDENGSFRRFYPPCIYRKDSSVVIKWGDELLPLEFTQESQVFSVDKSDVRIELGSAEYGNFKNISLLASFLDKETKTKYTMPFPIRLLEMGKKVEEDIENFKLALDMGLGEVLSILSEVPTGSSGDIKKLAEIPEDGEVQFLDCETIKLKDGRHTRALLTADGTKYWANDQINNLIDAGAKFPINVMRFLNEKGKNRYSIDAELPESEDLDWL